MSVNIESDITEMLLTKRDLLTEMLTLTNSTRFSGNDDEDVEAYTTLMEKRQKHIDEIKFIDAKLENEPYKSVLKNPSKKLDDNLYLIKHSTAAIAEKIIALDKKNAGDVEKVNSSIRKQLKSFKEKKNMSNLYNNDTIQNNKNYLV